MNTKFIISYLLCVGVIGVLLVWWTRRQIFSVEAKRKAGIKRLKRFESLKTTTPVDIPIEDAKEAALESVEDRFSIIKKLSFLLMISIWLVVLIYPFLKVVPATFVSFLVAASGIILGIAARPFIENLISGIVISFSGLTRIGDTVIIDEKYGTIEDIFLTHTVVKIWNWRRYILPNSRMLAKEVINCTINDTYEWAHVEFFVAYDSDLATVKKLAISAAAKSEYCADYEAPRFWIMEMEEKGFRCWIAAWVNSPIEAWELRNDIRTELVEQFKANGIKTHRIEIGDVIGNNSGAIGINQ